MIENLVLFLIGLVLLYAGAEFLVRGSSKLALLMRIRPIVVGLTVVAFGTSFPEFLTSMVAAWQDKIDVAVGNIIGSNIANICLILGISGMITPIVISPGTVRKELYWMLGSSILFWLFSYGGIIGHLEGIILLSGIFVFTFFLIKSGSEDRYTPNEEELTRISSGRTDKLPRKTRFLIYISMTIIGILLLMAGSNLLVTSSVYIARIIGVSEMVIGLSLVAFGTSLPELATAIISIIRRESEILVGNVVGSNIFNLLFVGGSLATFFSTPIKEHTIFMDLPIMLIISATLIPIILLSKKISRLTGIFFFGVYLLYMFYIFMQ